MICSSFIVSDRNRTAVIINGNVNDFGLGDASNICGVAHPLGFDNDSYGNRGPADAHQFRVKTHNIADKHRGDKNHFVHGFGDDFLGRMFADFNGGGNIYITENHAAENRAVRIRVFRHEDDANRRVGFGMMGFALAHQAMSLASAFEPCQFNERCGKFSPMQKKGEPTEIVAAGGVIIDEQGRVLLVHRVAYDDWSFPKGKVDKGETIEAAALREVREEAGLECEIIRPLSNSHYAYTTRKGEVKPKVVHYFLMKVTGGQLFTDGKETDDALWCSAQDAEKRLSYEGDREKLQEIK